MNDTRTFADIITSVNKASNIKKTDILKSLGLAEDTEINDAMMSGIKKKADELGYYISKSGKNDKIFKVTNKKSSHDSNVLRKKKKSSSDNIINVNIEALEKNNTKLYNECEELKAVVIKLTAEINAFKSKEDIYKSIINGYAKLASVTGET